MKFVITTISAMVLNLIQKFVMIAIFRNFAAITVNDVGYRFFMFNMTEEYVIENIKDFEYNEL